ncbi:MAG: hypothetical protein LIO97_10180 [Tannerellaceae bacterium]|nr:hypothetical protein [Tannerellaceae bacterium]
MDVFTIRDRTPEEYRLLAEKLSQQILKMEKILETLIIIPTCGRKNLPAILPG